MTRESKFCPKCRSCNISLWLGGATGIIYKCSDCDYLGSIILEGLGKAVAEKSKGRA